MRSIDGHQDSGGGYRLGCRLADGFQRCHRSHHPEQSEGEAESKRPKPLDESVYVDFKLKRANCALPASMLGEYPRLSELAIFLSQACHRIL